MSQDGNSGQGKDYTTDFIVLALAAAGLGVFGSAGAAFLAPVQRWALDSGIVVSGDSVLIAIPGSGVGLDLGRTLVAGAVLALILLAAVWSAARARHRRREL